MTPRKTQSTPNAARRPVQHGTSGALMTNQEEGSANPSVLECPKCRARVIVHVQATATCLPCARPMIHAGKNPKGQKGRTSGR